MNAYADLTTLKSSSYLNLTGTGDDAYLRKIIEVCSRAIDNYCGQFFYAWEGARYYDGAGEILLPPEPILSITTLKVDDNADGTFKLTYTVNRDFELYPLNGFPKLSVEISTRTDRVYGDFGGDGNKKAVEITGVFGYGDERSAAPYYDSGVTTAEELDATETAVDVSSGAGLAVGQTIRVESEQMYITTISTNTLTVTRGVNGTTAATHATGKAVYIYRYPETVMQASLIQAMRLWKRKDSAFQDAVGAAEAGGVLVYNKALDPDVKFFLANGGYRRVHV